MKKLILILLLAGAFIPSRAQYTQVTQLTDITPSDSCYEAVKNLVERYFILGTEEKRQNNAFLPNRPLTRTSFPILMVNALDQVNFLFKGFFKFEKKKKQDSLYRVFKRERFKGYTDAAVKNLQNSSQYKDIKNTDPDYKYIRALTDKYKLILGNAGNKFGPDQVMTVANIKVIFSRYFGAGKLIQKAGNLPVTRGAWAIWLSQLMELMVDDLTEISEGKEEDRDK